ncbi:MAG: carbohydrate binding family 9 domain-containing protein [candidate division Zixibacteria bacterium]|nr:carbohydrate binding family 9 domain-containing protein [candidate division Zixibacteria bacterium]
MGQFLSKIRQTTTTINCFAVILLLLVGSATAQSEYPPIFKPELNVPRTSGEIKVDGFLNDSGWQGAAEANHFHEINPGDNIKPPVETRAFITYDDDFLYLSAICYADPSKIRATLGRRDTWGGDNIGFFIDTYGDAAWAYTVNVNPFGVQSDALWTNGFGEDGMFDLVFESAGQITDSGYQVELAIPFASLRFPNKDVQTWRMQFWRHHYRETHYNITWAASDRNESNWVRDWGTLSGIKNVTPGKGIEILPAWTGSTAGALDIDADSNLIIQNSDAHGELSLSGKYAISSNITLDATINPDFSNVETDQFQIDVNSPTALSYPEKRPFFQEGSDLYRTRLNLVYTRSINKPDFAAKLTARLGRNSISFLSAHDLETPVIIPFEETSSSSIPTGKSYSNILRARRTIGSGSQVGILITDRRWEGGGSNTNYSTDATISFSRQVTLRAQAVGSYTKEPENAGRTGHLDYMLFDDNKYTGMFDGESFGGYAFSGNLSFNSRNFYISGSYTEKGPTFRADNGYMPRNNRRDASIYASYNLRFDKGLLERINIDINPMRIWNTDGVKKDEAIFTTFYIPLRFHQTSFTYQNLVSNEYFGGIHHDDILNNHFEFNTSPSELISFGGAYDYGHQLAYGHNAQGRQTKVRGWVDLNLFDRLFIENWVTHLKSYNMADDSELFKFFIYGSRISFQYNRKLSFRLFSQYNDYSKTWDFDPLITYQITPFSLFYVGSTYYVQKYGGLNADGTRLVDTSNPLVTAHEHYKLDSRQFFMKFQYLFQL